MEQMISLLKIEVYEKICEAYSLMGRTDTICLEYIPFPRSLLFSKDQMGSCMINAYELILECLWYPDIRKWEIEYETDEVSEQTPHIVNQR